MGVFLPFTKSQLSALTALAVKQGSEQWHLCVPVSYLSNLTQGLLTMPVRTGQNFWQEQQFFLNCRSEVGQGHDLGHTRTADTAQPCRIHKVAHGSFADQVLQPNRQCH